MSKEVDEKVVQMRFDNKNFEKNCAQSMSTLDKLKEKLSFKGVTKGASFFEPSPISISTCSVLKISLLGLQGKYLSLKKLFGFCISLYAALRECVE